MLENASQQENNYYFPKEKNVGFKRPSSGHQSSAKQDFDCRFDY